MKSNMIVMTSALMLAAVSNAWAQPAQQARPMPLQTPQVVSTPAPEARVSLGDAGTMWADELAAKRAAGIMPAAGESSQTPSVPVVAQPPKMVGGAQMLPSKNIIENAAASKDHTTLVKAIKAAGLDATLSAPGPFTVFAPTNKAFAKLPKKSLSDLMAPAGKDKLTKLLNYHVITGTHNAASIVADIQAGGGAASYTTVAGSVLEASLVKNVVTLTDENGNVSHIIIPDVYQSNGVIHVVDTVVIPK